MLRPEGKASKPIHGLQQYKSSQINSGQIEKTSKLLTGDWDCTYKIGIVTYIYILKALP